MKVGELRRLLEPFANEAEIIFGTKELCLDSWPEWSGATVRSDTYCDPDADKDVPTGKVYIELLGSGELLTD